MVSITDSEGREFVIRILDFVASETLVIFQKSGDGKPIFLLDITLNSLCGDSKQMTITVQELIANLKHHPDNTEITIKDVDDQEFAFVDFILENYILNIIIGTKEEGEESDEAEAV